MNGVAQKNAGTQQLPSLPMAVAIDNRDNNLQKIIESNIAEYYFLACSPAQPSVIGRE